MASAGQLQKSAVKSEVLPPCFSKTLPCSRLLSAAHPAVSPQAFCSRMTSSKEKLLMLQWGIAVWGIEVCMLLKLGRFVLAVLGAQWMAWAACGCQAGSWHDSVCLMVTLGMSSNSRGWGLLQFSP